MFSDCDSHGGYFTFFHLAKPVPIHAMFYELAKLISWLTGGK